MSKKNVKCCRTFLIYSSWNLDHPKMQLVFVSWNRLQPSIKVGAWVIVCTCVSGAGRFVNQNVSKLWRVPPRDQLFINALFSISEMRPGNLVRASCEPNSLCSGIWCNYPIKCVVTEKSLLKDKICCVQEPENSFEMIVHWQIGRPVGWSAGLLSERISFCFFFFFFFFFFFCDLSFFSFWYLIPTIQKVYTLFPTQKTRQ